MSMKWRTAMRRDMEVQDESEMDNWDEKRNGGTGLS